MKTSRPVGTDYPSKRAFDLVTAIVGVVLAAPVMLVAACAVAVSSRGPILFTARRVGRHGQPITVHKFRSMRPNATGPAVTAAGDPRVTPVGRVLRATKIDELPQLFDVIRGSMSLVGPRPEDPRFVDEYDDDLRPILEWRPGITSPASIEFRHEDRVLAGADDLATAYRQLSRAKVEIDLEYFPHASLRGDLHVIGRTIRALVDSAPAETHTEGAAS